MQRLADPPARSDLAHHWDLEPDLAFLNHGSFGACPRVVLEHQHALRAQLERQPVRFYVRALEDMLDDARTKLAAFVGCDPQGLAFVPNATFGVNSVLRSMHLQPGDELITTNHEYNACNNCMRYVAQRAGAAVTCLELPWPVRDEDQIIDAVLRGVSDRTRLVLLSHVTSPTAIVLPIARLVRALRERGIETLIDGAHAPGMIELDIEAIGAAYYTANCHKWICAPKGAGFLHVREDLRDTVRPAVISHGANAARTDRSRYHLEFDWCGTDDPTAYLSVPTAIESMQRLAGDWDSIRAHNRALCLHGRDVLCEALGVEAPVPDAMIGSIASLPLPDSDGPPPVSALYRDALQDELMNSFGVEVPIIPWPQHPKRLVRISAQRYNSPAEYEHLARALVDLL